MRPPTHGASRWGCIPPPYLVYFACRREVYPWSDEALIGPVAVRKPPVFVGHCVKEP